MMSILSTNVAALVYVELKRVASQEERGDKGAKRVSGYVQLTSGMG
jgi:hypothetical protein